jgi:putative PIN family toxin of toxin-antitoxin system
MTRVVFDTNVLYSTILKPVGVPAQVFDLVIDGLILPCVSDDVLAEYRDVLFRPELDLSASRRRKVLDILSVVALHVAPTEHLKISDHEDDNRIYECADAAMADYIVTGNTKHFPKPHKNTSVIRPRDLLELFKTGQKA